MHTAPLSRFQRARHRHRQGGVVFVLAVFAVVLLTVLAVAICAAVRVELLASRTSLQRVESLFLAEAGIHQARAILLYDDPTVDTLQDMWGPACDIPLDLPQKLGPGYYRVRVHDACGRLDINLADYATLVALTGDPEVAAAILDWRDEDSVPNPDGAELDYYAALPHPYLPRNGPFQTLGELLLVRGVTPQLFFGDLDSPGLVHLTTVHSLSLNTDARGERRVGLNQFGSWSEERFRDMIMAKLGTALTLYEAGEIWRGLNDLSQMGQQYTSLSQLATAAGLSYDAIVRVVDLVDPNPALRIPGRVNVNTALPEVLAALPGSSPEVARAIVDRRESAPFTSRGEVAELLLQQASGPQVFAQMIDLVTTKSSSYIIQSMGYPENGRAFRTVQALVGRQPESVAVMWQAEEDWPLPPTEQDTITIARR